MTAKEETKGVSVGVATVNMNPLKRKENYLSATIIAQKEGYWYSHLLSSLQLVIYPFPGFC
ncbi:cytoplasmic protein [Salmonella enterica]|nr:cytoplasmic protein [Salmonella enterica subsp. enterica serovar Galiema]ECF6969426.1 cytoplasmic protein [Salmonella enterica subsp. enterica]EKR0127397.1 cytoplasmic protein [Salmonella enterica]ELE5231321.1 cytoplasmic protein [Salmonella enterica subsp. enterica serovar Colindale]EDV4332355.1 cytoplasmic protein [Salmonella enterica subsp. enterica]